MTKLNYTLKRSLRANGVKRCHACDVLLDMAVIMRRLSAQRRGMCTAPAICSKFPSPPHFTLLNLAIALALPFPRMSSLGLLMHRSTRCVRDKASATAEVRDDSVMGARVRWWRFGAIINAPPPRQRMHVNGELLRTRCGEGNDTARRPARRP